MAEQLQPFDVSVRERIVAAVEEVLFVRAKVEVGEEVRVLLREKLAAAGEDILRLFEERVVDYENRLWRSDRELCRLHKLLDVILKPQVKLRRADLQQPSVCKEELPPEQQERSPGLGQEEPEPPHIKEEEEELCSSQEAGITKFPFHPVCVKSEIDEERAQCFQLNESQTEENREAETQTGTSTEQMKTEVGGEDCGMSEAAGSLDPASDSEPICGEKPLCLRSSEMETEVSDEDWKETREPQSGVKYTFSQEFSSSEHNIHERLHTGDGPYHCQQCGKAFTQSGFLKKHQCVHSGDRPYKCQQCGKGFIRSGDLKKHQRIHTGERPYKCQLCGNGFSRAENLKRHERSHTGEKPFQCQQCGKGFHQSADLKKHQHIHTGDRPYKCHQCGIGFSRSGDLNVHQRIHTEDRPYKCQQCGKRFSRSANLKRHHVLHTGEKPFHCQQCGKRFTWSVQLKTHNCIQPAN